MTQTLWTKSLRLYSGVVRSWVSRPLQVFWTQLTLVYLFYLHNFTVRGVLRCLVTTSSPICVTNYTYTPQHVHSVVHRDSGQWRPLRHSVSTMVSVLPWLGGLRGSRRGGRCPGWGRRSATVCRPPWTRDKLTAERVPLSQLDCI